MSRLYQSIRNNYWANLFTINLRNLLGIGFLIGGLRKINGEPFANPGQAGEFFEFLDALHANLIYYEFIGWAQLIAGVLLITQRFATLGAMIYFPIILNIMVFTVFSVGSLTPYIASLMCLGTAYLLMWDYYKWYNIFSTDNHLKNRYDRNSFPTYRKVWLINGYLTVFFSCNGWILLILLKSSENFFITGGQSLLASLIICFIINLISNVVDILIQKRVVHLN